MNAFENICTSRVDGWLARVWFTRDEWGPYAREDQDRLGTAFVDLISNLAGIQPHVERPDPLNVAMILAENLPRVSAVQVTAPSGAGSVYYPDWP